MQLLDPIALGYSGKRRTVRLRREEVAQRANISTTWHTWLEQGRGGAPSARVLESLSEALLLTDAERPHLFLIGIGKLPIINSKNQIGISKRLQRLLDSLKKTPAIVVNAEWDVIAWNAAASFALTDYASLEMHERNVIRRMFLDAKTRDAQGNIDSVARFIVATFRAQVTKTGQSARAKEIISELSKLSDDFVSLWSENDICSTGEGQKSIFDPPVDHISFEFSSFSVDGRPDLKMILFTPETVEDDQKLNSLITR